MIKLFETQEAFETWLGDNVLPSKTIAYVAESKEYFIHTNNMGEDEIVHGTYAELKSLDSVPKDILQEIEVFDNNLHPAPPQPVPGDLEGRVEYLETTTTSMGQEVEELTSKTGTLTGKVANLETANTQTNQKVDTMDAQLTAGLVVVAAVNEEVDTMKTTVAGNTAAIVSHSTSIEGLQESTFTLESDVSGLKTDTSKLERKIADMTLDESIQSVSYRQFNAGFKGFGWLRTIGESGPGAPAYNGLGLTATTKFREENGVKYYTLVQLFFEENSKDVKIRTAAHTVYTDYTSEWSATDWKTLGGGGATYTSGNGITINPDGSINIDPSVFKTVAGQEIVGEGDITVGVDEDLVRQIANSVCDERIGDIQTVVSYILGDIDAELGDVLGDE